MTTKPSSSPRESTARQPALIDSAGRTHQPGKLIGRGGEGSIFTIEGQPALVAKVYHHTPLPLELIDKLEVMVACRSPALDAIAAWPQTVLYGGPAKGPCGILMPRIADARQLHELYGTANRRKHFAGAQWHHLVLAARNIAAAFDTMHTAGIVIGDVNQGNLLVDAQMCVRFIDCDSLQISRNGRTFLCGVGTPHFTPPELQSKNLREVSRTVDHDHFGLAVLIFHLLFVGRHPFAGRFSGVGDLTIEKAIGQRRFAFSRNRTATQMEPPPFSLVLNDIPPALAELFESAFRGRPQSSGRPTAQAWTAQLDALIRQRKGCMFDPAHVYFAQLKECPWCRIENEGGPSFFVSAETIATLEQRLAHLEDRLRQLTIPEFPGLNPHSIAPPKVLEPKQAPQGTKISQPDVAAGLLASSVVLCLAGLLSPAAVSPWALLAGTVAALAGGALLRWGKASRSRRETVVRLQQQFMHYQNQLAQQANAIRAAHTKRQAAYRARVAELTASCEHYSAADTQLKDVLGMQRISARNEFLSTRLIQEHVAEIPGMTFALASILQSYGIESAIDIDPFQMIGVPLLTPLISMELINWREQLESDFVHQPEHGVTEDRLASSGEAAAKRFKIYQARRILSHFKQVETLAAEAREQLDRDEQRFYEQATEAREAASELRDFESARRNLERRINRSPQLILAAALAIPAVAWLLWLIINYT
jgi:DNA-binding helix-hairpin-helix protein with protein kinase domain